MAVYQERLYTMRWCCRIIDSRQPTERRIRHNSTVSSYRDGLPTPAAGAYSSFSEPSAAKIASQTGSDRRPPLVPGVFIFELHKYWRRPSKRAGKWWVPAIPDHERQASVPCVRVVSRGTMFYLDGSRRGPAGHGPDGLGGLLRTQRSLIEWPVSDVAVHYWYLSARVSRWFDTKSLYV